MMKKKYTVKTSSRYKREFRNVIKRGYNENKMIEVVDLLATGEPLPQKYKDHDLYGNWEVYRECHIAFDWILVYRIFENELILFLTSTGSHSDVLKI